MSFFTAIAPPTSARVLSPRHDMGFPLRNMSWDKALQELTLRAVEEAAMDGWTIPYDILGRVKTLRANKCVRNVQNLSAQIRKMQGLTELDLSNNDIDIDGARDILQSNHPALQTLNFSENRILSKINFRMKSKLSFFLR